MSKVSFSKLGLKKIEEIKTIEINGQEIEVKQYLPIMDKLLFISSIINESADENNFANPVKNELFIALEIINYYTNITFTDKQREDPAKLYDLIKENGTIDAIISAIPEEEYNTLCRYVTECVQSVYAYRNSAYGIIEGISNNYQDMDGTAEDIQEKLGNPENLALLKDILTKIG